MNNFDKQHGDKVMNRSIIDCGGIPDSEKVQTEVLQCAIDQLSFQGGGTLNIEGGSYITGTIQLKNNVRLNISSDSKLLGSVNIEDYPELPACFHSVEVSYSHKALIWAENARNIAVTGEGTIDFRGEAESFKVDRDEFWNKVDNRPAGVAFFRCTNVRFEKISMRNSPFWMHRHIECRNVFFSEINLHNHCNYNNDGIDLDNCSNVVIDSCHIDTCDDAVCLKSMTSGHCRNIIVYNSILRSHYNAVKIGTETATEVSGLLVDNCELGGSAYPNKIMGTGSRAVSGISLISCDGADLQYITIKNCSISNVMAPLYIRRQNRKRALYFGMPEEHSAGKVENIIISNITAKDTTMPSVIAGIEGSPVKDIKLDNWTVECRGGGDFSQWEDTGDLNWTFPDCTNRGKSFPALGFFLSYIDGVDFNNINIFPAEPDQRSIVSTNSPEDCRYSGKVSVVREENMSR